jgi:hypothetical protein
MQKMLQFTPGEWISIRECAARFGIVPATVQTAIRTGKLPMVNNGRGKRWVLAWKAAELWENMALKQRGERRCRKCQEIKRLEDFPKSGKPAGRKSICKICFRPIAARRQKKFRDSKSGSEWYAAWYAEKGGRGIYQKRGWLKRKKW